MVTILTPNRTSRPLSIGANGSSRHLSASVFLCLILISTHNWTSKPLHSATIASNVTDSPYFLQVSHHDSGKNMMSSELVSMTLIRNTVPDLAPLPIDWGTYARDSDIHFYMCSFHDMTDDVPEIQPLAAKMAELHQKGLSPNGKYGFSVPTYQCKWPQPVEWKESCESLCLSQCFCMTL